MENWSTSGFSLFSTGAGPPSSWRGGKSWWHGSCATSCLSFTGTTSGTIRNGYLSIPSGRDSRLWIRSTPQDDSPVRPLWLRSSIFLCIYVLEGPMKHPKSWTCRRSTRPSRSRPVRNRSSIRYTSPLLRTQGSERTPSRTHREKKIRLTFGRPTSRGSSSMVTPTLSNGQWVLRAVRNDGHHSGGETTEESTWRGSTRVVEL